jgi:1-acyl-sn-glycerol-3-phosphate acyltransferase
MEAEQTELGFDPFGFQPEFLKYVLPVTAWLYRHYFRVEARGFEHVPDQGSVLLVSNHSGQIPIDGLMIGTGLLVDREVPRMARSMVERWVPTIPFVSYVLARCGQVVGTRENCRLLLNRGASVLVFPEGVAGIGKIYDRAYELQPFGLGFMRLALETDTPIVPISVVGTEEQMPAIANSERLAKLLGSPGFPITPTWPFLGPLGAIPLPVKIHIDVGEPMHFEGSPDDEDRIVDQKVERVRGRIREMIHEGLRRRRGVFF